MYLNPNSPNKPFDLSHPKLWTDGSHDTRTLDQLHLVHFDEVNVSTLLGKPNNPNDIIYRNNSEIFVITALIRIASALEHEHFDDFNLLHSLVQPRL